MASKSSGGRRYQPHTSRPSHPDLQKSILEWLYDDLRRRHEGDSQGIPYTKLVEAVTADKARVTMVLRQLMHQGLVEVTLPRGAWIRYVGLTEAGKAYANTMRHQERQSRWQRYADGAAEFMRGEKRWRSAPRQRQRESEARQQRTERWTRRRSKRGRW